MYPDRELSSWPKLTLVTHRQSHWIVGLHVCQGPNQDAHLLRKVMPEVHRQVHFFRLLADAAYDSEENHVLCREKLGIPRTVIPARKRSDGRRLWPAQFYRRQMRRRFHRRVYRQRMQVECVIFRFKRHLGDALSARRWTAQIRECRLRVLTFDLALLVS